MRSGRRVRAMVLDRLSATALTGIANPFFPAAGSDDFSHRVIGRRLRWGRPP
jgi:hypothetical protein